MAKILYVSLNGRKILEYQRDQRVPGHQRKFLDKMDDDMNRGFRLGDEMIEQPDGNDRMNYVSMKLVQGIQSDNNSLVAAMCAYIANRYSAVREIQAWEEGDQVAITFTFD